MQTKNSKKRDVGVSDYQKGLKLMKKTISMVLALLMLTALLCSCGSAVQNEGLTVDDFADSSENQQGWLRLNDSSLVINPDEYQGNESGNGNRLGLNLGILDEAGNVTKSINDLIFLIENNSANGVGGEVIWTTSGLDDIGTALRWGSKATVDYNDGSFVASSTGAASSALNFATRLPIEFSKDIVAIFNISNYSAGATFVKDDEETEPGWGLSGSIQVIHPDGKETIAITAQASNEETGRFVAYFSDVVASQTNYNLAEATGQMNGTVTIYGDGTTITVDEYQVVYIDKGFHYADSEAKTTWYPYAIVSELEYPNGTKAETTDFFSNYSTVARKITFKAGGLFTLAGKVEGTLTYDEAGNVMIVEGSGYKYVISPKKKQNVMFYNSEDDMLNNRNGSTEPTSSTKYWTVSLGRIEVDTDVFVAVSLDASKDVETLVAETKKATESGNTDKRLDYVKQYWESYIHVFELPNDIIANVPGSAE